MNSEYDVIVIGGGPAGLMAAAAAGHEGVRVLLLEKGDRLGRKLIISGGGRCNVTNRKPVDQLVAEVPGNGRFMFSALSRFGPEEIIRFFEGLGIRLKEEDRGRMFPTTDRAVTVANALVQRLRNLGVAVRLQAPVGRLLTNGDGCGGVELKTGEQIHSRAVVVAVGGKSVPKTGSTGDGYAWAQAAGHTVTPLYPTEVPLVATDRWVADRVLQGLSLRDVVLHLFDPRGKRLTTQRGDIIFTHFGLSGPAALRVGTYVSPAQLKQGPVPLMLTIDLLPEWTAAEAYQRTLDRAAAEPKKAVKNVLKAVLPERMVPLLLAGAGIPETTTYAHLARENWLALARLSKGFPVTVTGTLPLAEAFVTGGGVSVKEIEPATMQSKVQSGLFFAGEIMDVHAHTGGYNITLAFASGHTAGRSAAAWVRGGSA
ncbi:MAG TPA: NAD(P)/FAD-dependent oxidoreductase [Symbiobacteriaceae bacterium]|jgi:hypothetical protein